MEHLPDITVIRDKRPRNAAKRLFFEKRPVLEPSPITTSLIPERTVMRNLGSSPAQNEL
jgi:hypothetical protein